jgi:hypothetical protein
MLLFLAIAVNFFVIGAYAACCGDRKPEDKDDDDDDRTQIPCA